MENFMRNTFDHPKENEHRRCPSCDGFMRRAGGLMVNSLTGNLERPWHCDNRHCNRLIFEANIPEHDCSEEWSGGKYGDSYCGVCGKENPNSSYMWR